MELDADGQRDVAEDGDDLRFDASVDAVVGEVLHQLNHDVVAVRKKLGVERSAQVADDADRRDAHLQQAHTYI